MTTDLATIAPPNGAPLGIDMPTKPEPIGSFILACQLSGGGNA